MNPSKAAKRSAEPFNVLFTCIGRRVALVRAFREALAELGLPGQLLGTDITASAPAFHTADAAFVVPPVRSLHYVPRLTELVEEHRVKLLIPLTDLDLRTLSRHQDDFAQRGCTVMIAPPDVVSTCRNKIEFNHLLSRVGLRGIRSDNLDDFLKNPFYPCFVKPIHGSAAWGSGAVRNEREMQAHVRTYGDHLIVQEFVPGQEYTIDVFRRRDGVVCAVVPRQRLSIRCGEVEKGITVNDAQLIEHTLKLVENLPGLWGVINAQCRRPPGEEPRFFEVNLRFGGGAPLSIAAGVNLPRMVILETLGRPVEPQVGQFTDGLLMLRYDEAVYTRATDPSQLPGYRQPLNR